MFEDFIKSCPPQNEIKPAKKRVEKNIAALRTLIGKEETRSRRVLKPLIIAGVTAVFSAATLVTVSASMQGKPVNFFMGGEEREGEFYDYVDGDGYRRFSFSALVPFDTELYAVVYDIDASEEEKVRVITEDTDPVFMENLRLYMKAKREFWGTMEPVEENITDTTEIGVFSADPDDPAMPKPEDFGLVFDDSELCQYSYSNSDHSHAGGGEFGGEFMHKGAAAGMPSGGHSNEAREGDMLSVTYSYYYYVGKE